MTLLTHRMQSETSAQNARSLGIAAALVLAIMALSIVARFPSLQMPVDRDISAYATIGMRMTHGELPYRDYFDHKQPLVYLVYWMLAEVAPRSNASIQLTAAFIAGMTGALLFLLLRNELPMPRAFAVGCLAVTLGAARYVEGVDLNTEHLLLPFACAAVLVPYRYRNSPWRGLPILAGLLGGLAMMAKGVAVFILPAGVVVLVATRIRRSQSLPATLVSYGVGTIIPVGMLVAFYSLQGGLADLVYANVTYNSLYISQRPPPFLLEYGGVQTNSLLGASLFVGLVTLAKSKGRDLLAWVLILWLGGSMLGAKMGRFDFPHYFAPTLPPAITLLFLPLREGALSSKRLVTSVVGVLIAAVSLPFVVDVALTFGRTPNWLATRLYGEQAVIWTYQEEVGEWLRNVSGPTDTLFVAYAEPGFYWQSGLRPSTRFLYDFPLMVDASAEEQLERALSVTPPRFVVIPGDTIPPYLSFLSTIAYDEVAAFGPIHVLQERSSPEGLAGTKDAP